MCCVLQGWVRRFNCLFRWAGKLGVPLGAIPGAEAKQARACMCPQPGLQQQRKQPGSPTTLVPERTTPMGGVSPHALPQQPVQAAAGEAAQTLLASVSAALACAQEAAKGQQEGLDPAEARRRHKQRDQQEGRWAACSCSTASPAATVCMCS